MDTGGPIEVSVEIFFGSGRKLPRRHKRRMQDMDRLADLNAGMLPFAKLLRMTLIAAEPDRVKAELMVRDNLCTRPAVLHGDAIFAFGAVGTASGRRRQKSSLLS